MNPVVITLGVMVGAAELLYLVCGAPLWACVIGGWAFWAAVRPKEWT